MNQGIATQLVRMAEGHVRHWMDVPDLRDTYGLFNLVVVERLLDTLRIELGKR